MAVIDPRLGNPFLPAPVPAGPTRRTLVVGKRVRLMGVLMALPFMYLWLEYGKMEFHAPAPSRPAAALVTRGRILAGDGTVLATSVNKPDATIWDVAPRRYPQGTLAAQLVGFTNMDGGLEGIEHFQEARLATGQDVKLTIDPAFQASAEAGLAGIIHDEQADAGSVVAIEAGTGRVLAVANYPTFSPAHFKDAPAQAYGNRAFMFQYEPGSTIKALVAAALINEGDATPTTTLEAPMWRVVGGWTIHDAVPHPPTLDLTHVLRYSSNVGISTLSERMGM
ncbi:MAG TPA: penicillin-binding transpeptidase domain-containing protein, partial [Deinococcales bacterium]|nr:penicillin-binding transpeptidase domain-containing protein [Deinococcales bacterium]